MGWLSKTDTDTIRYVEALPMDDGAWLALRFGFASQDDFFCQPGPDKDYADTSKAKYPEVASENEGHNPAELVPGTLVAIPKFVPEARSAKEKETTQFTVTLSTRKFKVKLETAGGPGGKPVPYANGKYRLEVPFGPRTITYEGTTDADGYCEEREIYATSTANIWVGSEEKKRVYVFGGLVPMSGSFVTDGGERGIAQRLNALGYNASPSSSYVEITSAGPIDRNQLLDAVRRFCDAEGQTWSGQLDDELKGWIEEAYTQKRGG